jgi:hypothetical protein
MAKRRQLRNMFGKVMWDVGRDDVFLKESNKVRYPRSEKTSRYSSTAGVGECRPSPFG